MTVIINGTTGITNDGGYTGDGVSFADTTPANTLVTTTSGRVGVGTNSPSQNLQVVSTTNGQGILVSGSVDNVALNLSNSGTSGKTWSMFSTNTNSGAGGGALGFFDGTAYRMILDSSGNLLVGTTGLNSVEKFNVTTANSGSNRGICNFYNSSATSTTKIANRLIRLAANANGADNCIEFTDNVANNYYFGGNNGGAYVMANSNGVRLSNGGTSWASDSDERVKDIIEPITDAANKVSTLRAVIGKYKTDEEGTRRSFLIAQDVQAVLPEAVVAQQDEIGTLSLAYTDTIPLLVAAIQEQQAIINDLKARIETLENV